MTVSTTETELADVLAEVNQLRAERGQDPIEALPCGDHCGYSCPLVGALDAQYVGTSVIMWPDDRSQPLPPVLRRFVIDFGAGRYPELIAHD